jgi:hypothetical protein
MTSIRSRLSPRQKLSRSLSVTAERGAKFFVVEQLLEAPDNGVRAGILLRLPDAVIAAKARQLQEACKQVGFDQGSDYVDVRHAHQSAQRDARGNLPSQVIDQLEYWRNGMVAISEGAR